MLTFFAVGVAVRPADTGHQYGHGKAEHLASLAEAAFLLVASVVIIYRAVLRLTAAHPPSVDVTWWSLLVIGVVIVVDVGRTIASRRAAREYHSVALASNALHFASDLAGSLAVLVGTAARARRPAERGRPRRALRRASRSRRGRPAHAPEHRRAHGYGSARCGGSGARRRSRRSSLRSSCGGCGCARPAGATSRTS